MTTGYINGIDAETGELLADFASSATLWQHREEVRLPSHEERQLTWWTQRHSLNDPDRLPVFEVDPDRLDQAGWAVLWGPSISPNTKEALEPLLQHRWTQSGKLFRELTLPAGITSPEFRLHHEIGFGPAEPSNIPYYLFIVADPREVPFELQYGLDVQYAVGRLHLESDDDYASYAASVVRSETNGDERRRATVFGVDGDREGDQFLMEALVSPLTKRLRAWSAKTSHRPQVEQATDSRKAAFAALLEDPPGFLFAAGHGLACRHDDPTLPKRQGALVCSDSKGPGGVPPESYFAGDDIPAGTDLRGMITFLFACYGAGCPTHDDFSEKAIGKPEQVAPYPLVSHLARRMVSAGAQAFVGHIDRAWGTSFDFSSRKGDQVRVFDSACKQLLSGYRLGHALEWINQRYAEGATELSSLLRARSLDPGASEYLSLVRKTTLDARNYVILGDPAVRLPGYSGPDKNEE